MELERTISTKGQVVIPKDIRKKTGLKPGSEIVFEIEDNKIIIKRKMSPREFVEDFGNVQKRLKKAIGIKGIKKTIEEQYKVP